jgi:hypothetical protein
MHSLSTPIKNLENQHYDTSNDIRTLQDAFL